MSLKNHHEFMLRYSKSLMFEIIKRPSFIFLGFLAFSSMSFFSVLIFLIEHAANPKFESFLNAAYFTVGTMTSVGVSELSPVTPLGKMITMLMMLLGTFIFVSFMGVVASTVLELELKLKSKRN